MRLFDFASKGKRHGVPAKAIQAPNPDLAGKLRGSTMAKLYELNFPEGHDVSSLSAEEIWNAPRFRKEKAFAKLEKHAKKIAATGSPSMTIRIDSAYDGVTPAWFESGTSIDRLAETTVAFDVWNFMVDVEGKRRPAFHSKDESDRFCRYVARKVSEHFKELGLQTKVADRPHYSLYSEVSVSWMSDAEYNQAQTAMSSFGAYDAYAAGVPLEDIIA